MIQTLMRGLNQKNMEAMVKSYDLKEFYHPELFPLKETYDLTFKTLSTRTGLRVAADIVARGASVDEKTREAVALIMGDIPKTAILRSKDENELNQYKIMLAMAGNNPDQKALIDAWAEDTEFCWNGTASRIEWMALRQISRGKITLTNTNNASVVSEFDVDYELPASHKLGYDGSSASWATNSAKPISVDFRKMVERAKAEGITLRYAFMNLSTFVKFTQIEEVIKTCASFAQNALNIAQIPSLEQVNAALLNLPYLRGLQIVVLDQDITIELKDGSRATANPFEDDVVMFAESKQLGTTYWMKPADLDVQAEPSLKTLHGYTCIKKYAETNPLKEVTMGIANAFPAWTTAPSCYLLDVTHSSWSLDA